MKKCKDAKMQKLIKILNLCLSTHLLQIPGDNIANFGKGLAHITGKTYFSNPCSYNLFLKIAGIGKGSRKNLISATVIGNEWPIRSTQKLESGFGIPKNGLLWTVLDHQYYQGLLRTILDRWSESQHFLISKLGCIIW